MCLCKPESCYSTRATKQRVQWYGGNNSHRKALWTEFWQLNALLNMVTATSIKMKNSKSTQSLQKIIRINGQSQFYFAAHPCVKFSLDCTPHNDRMPD